MSSGMGAFVVPGRKRNTPMTVYPDKPCIECGRPSLGRNLCPSHYNAAWRTENAERYTHTCGHCGEQFKTWRKKMASCSLLCQRTHALKTARVARVVQMKANAKYAKPVYVPVPDDIKETNRRARRGPLRAAYEDGEWRTLLSLIEQGSTKSDTGCWEWQGTIKDGYPKHASLSTLCNGVHRAALEAKHGKPLGKQAAHHMCANTICVNPDHLQPVTHRENAAEMLARNYYITRIKQLEEALAATEPEHELLLEVGIA